MTDVTPEQLALPSPDELTPQEKRLVHCAAQGEWWEPEEVDGESPDMDPANALHWHAGRTIRPRIIRCLATGEVWPGETRSWPVSTKGVRVLGARFTDQLDLEGAVLNRTLWLHACAFERPIDMSDAETRTVSLHGSRLSAGLRASRVTVRGALYLRNRFVAKGEVNLAGATIEGQLACADGTFENPKGRALYCDGIKVGADIHLGHGFVAKGEVNLIGATVEGQLSCVKGTFENPKDRALNCDAITVGADVHLSDGFVAKGEVNFVRATIEGQLSCVNGTFENPKGRALNCDAIKVGASMLLSNGFVANGEVDLLGATIKGQLTCVKGTFENPKGRALNCDAITVGTDVHLRHGFVAKGEVNLVRATVKGNLLCIDANIDNPGGEALDLSLAEIGAGLFLYNLRHGEDDNPGPGGRLLLNQAKCRTFSDDEQSWPEAGLLALDGFTYERFHDCKTHWRTRRAWLELQSASDLIEEFRPQPWTQAIAVLRAMGHDDDARELAMCREKARMRSRGTSRRKRIWLEMLRRVIGFGYKPWRAGWWSLAVVMIGWFVFATAANLGFMAPRDGSVQAYLATTPGNRLPAQYTRFNAPIFALDNFLPIIELGQDAAWEPDDEQLGHERSRHDRSWVEIPRLVLGHGWTVTGSVDAPAESRNGWLLDRIAGGEVWAFRLGFHRFYYWFEELAGWLLVSLFIAGMSGIMKKE